MLDRLVLITAYLICIVCLSIQNNVEARKSSVGAGNDFETSKFSSKLLEL